MPKRGRSKSMWILAKIPSSLGFHDATQGLNRSLMITVYFYPIYSLQKTLITPRNADLALQVSNIQQTRFQLDRKGLLLLASNSVLNLHFFMALPGRVIPIMIHDMSLTVAILVCKSDFNKDNKACSQTFSVHDFCFNPPFSHSSLKVLPRGASYMPGNVELKRVELHRRLMNSQDDWTWKIHPNWVGTGRFMKFLISWIWRNCC